MRRISCPTISVIVPVYNAEATLDRCIQSILNQTYKDFELLLVDDGSKDDSGSICDGYAENDSRVKVLHKKNGGASSARNSGLNEAIGEWVTFCDADDVVLDEWLNTFMSNTEGVDMVCQGMILDYTLMKDTEPIPNKILAVDYEGAVSGGLDSLHKHGLRGSTCLKLFRKSIIDDHNLRFNVAYNYMEDEEFILRYMQYCNNIKSVSKANYYYFYLGYQQLKKYSIQNSYKLFRSLYMSARNIYGNADSVVLDYYVDELTASLLASFRNSFNLSLLRDYREILGERVLNTKLFPITKWSIYVDASGYISSCVIYLHNKLRTRTRYRRG